MDNIQEIVGIDEVGRGCLAGPVVAGAVILSCPIEGLKDSKKLSKKQRERLDKEIRVSALDFGVGWCDVATLNKVGLTAAVTIAMKDALNQIKSVYTRIIMDGNYNFLLETNSVELLIKADNLIPSVSAASIIAKVARDNWMIEAASNYPNYGFENHVGYGTKLHMELLKLHGPSDLHRINYKPVRDLISLRTDLAD
jgi:ribonuclease HII